MSDELTAVGMHVYAGGFTLGVERHFRVLCHLEEGSYGVRTFIRNRPEIFVYVGRDKWPIRELANNVSFMYCNPPCAVWSQASFNRSTMKLNDWTIDERLNCWRACFEMMTKIQPTVFACESVTRAFSQGRSFMNNLAREAEKIGYATTWLLLNYADVGVPQNRKRFFCLFHKIALTIKKPVSRWITVDEALCDVVPIVRNEHLKYADDIRGSKPGCKIKTSTNKIGFLNKRIHGDRVSPVVVGPVLVHPRENRHLTTEELAALSTFPSSFTWPKTTGVAGREISRGVPPSVGEWLADQVKRSIITNEQPNFARRITLNYISDRKDDETIDMFDQVLI